MTNDIKDDDSKSEEGLAFRYPPRPKRRLSVAPSTFDDNRFNAIVFDGWPRPVACVKLDPERFPFDSSFPHATVAHDLARLFELRAPENKAGEKLAVFGHADPTGAEDYNKTLSGRRAKAVFALVSRQPELWDELHQQRFSGDTWGLESLQLCLQALGFDPGSTDGKASPKLTQATHDFQASDGLPEGPLDRPTRLALFRAYMDKLLGGTKDAPRSFAIEDFVGEGKAADFRGAFQGCGKRNPAMIVSAEQDRELQKEENHAQRNRVEAPNRRVLIFLYEPRSVRNLDAVWECPSASAPMSDCDKVKWKAMDQVLKPGAKRREVRRKGQTFGCKFYDFQARLSPCEALRGTVKVFLRDEQGQKFAKPVDYEIRSFSSVRRGTTNKEGLLEEGDFPIDRSMVLSWLKAEPPVPAKSKNDDSAVAEQPAPKGLPDDDELISSPNDSDDGDASGTGAQPGNPEANAPPIRALGVRGAKPQTPQTPPQEKEVGASEGSPSASVDAAIDSRFVHHTRVFLPLLEEDKDRRDLLWLANLSFPTEPGKLRESMARFALDYGLAANTPEADQSKFLQDIQQTGKEAKPENASDATAAATAEPADPAGGAEPPTATVRPACRCENSPLIEWRDAGHLFFRGHDVFGTRDARGLRPPPDLAFTMPLFDGKFLGGSLASESVAIHHEKLPLWKRDRTKGKGAKGLFPRGSTKVTGASKELRARLDWAQQAIYIKFCRANPDKPPPSDPKKLMTLLAAFAGTTTTETHGTLRDDDGEHGCGCAIDVTPAIGLDPWICVGSLNAANPDDLSQLAGEVHALPAVPSPKDAKNPTPEEAKEIAAFKLAKGNPVDFLRQNVWEPAMAAFERASQLKDGISADLSLAKNAPERFRKAPEKSFCEQNKYADIGVSVAETYRRFKKVHDAVVAYFSVDTIDTFRALISETPQNASLTIDEDLVVHARAGKTDLPPPAAPISTAPPGQPGRRKRQAFRIGAIRADGQLLRALFLQRLRDADIVSMVLVHGSNSFGPTRPKDAVAFTVPCVWPEGWSVFVPRARPVRKGFLNLSEVTVVSLVESGLTWLGGMGSGDKGTPIVDFSGDMMHFDLRTQRRCGSADLDKWMDENDSIRKPMKGDITLAQAQIDLARASAENFFAGGNNANELAANTKAVQELGGAKTRAAAGVDDQLKALIEEAKQTWDKLQALRSKPFVPGGIYDGLCDRLDEAVVAVQYATDLDQVKKGNDSATDVRSLTTLTPIVKTPPASPALPTPEARVTLSDALAAIRSAEKVGIALSQKLVAASKTVAKAPAKNDAAINADLQVFKDTEEKAEQALTKAST